MVPALAELLKVTGAGGDTLHAALQSTLELILFQHTYARWLL